MATPPAQRLKLRARDRDDLAVVSACLQDALLAPADVAYLPRERRLVMLVNRFRWEARAAADDLPDAAPPGEAAEAAGRDVRFEEAPLYERVHCAVTFDRVRGVRYRGFRRGERGRVLELLAVTPEPGGVLVSFAGGAAIRLACRSLHCHLEDLGEPWPTRWRPHHGPAAGDETSAGADGEAGR